MCCEKLTAIAVAVIACGFLVPAKASPPLPPLMPQPVPQLDATLSGTTPIPANGHVARISPVASVDMLLTLAFSLRDIRYRYGGASPKAGFDCSGFVRYVFQHALGVILPRNSRAQFHSGTRVARSALRPGDLVFFRTHGRRISHVGIYLDAGRFIHAPSAGESIRVDNLADHYWARHFAGARRADGIAQI